MDKKAGSPYEKAKQSVMHRRRSTEEIKCSLREQFKERIRNIRATMTSAQRRLQPHELVRRGYEDLRAALLLDERTPDLEEALALLNDVEVEMADLELQAQAEQYESDLEKETESMIETHACQICGSLQDMVNSVICARCTNVHFND